MRQMGFTFIVYFASKFVCRQDLATSLSSSWGKVPTVLQFKPGTLSTKKKLPSRKYLHLNTRPTARYQVTFVFSWLRLRQRSESTRIISFDYYSRLVQFYSIVLITIAVWYSSTFRILGFPVILHSLEIVHRVSET